MSNPEEIQVNENNENQLLNQEQQDTINVINTLLANNNKEISTINDLLNKEFLKGISAELAGQILNNIPENLKNDVDVKNIITVLSAKISTSKYAGNKDNLESYFSNNANVKHNHKDVVEGIDISDYSKIDLSNYKNDISGMDSKYGPGGLAGEIQQCLSLIGSSGDLQNLKTNLEVIKKIIVSSSIKLEDLNKINQFLSENQINIYKRNSGNISPLLDGIHNFLNDIGKALSTQRKADNILDKQEQKIKAKIEKQRAEELQETTRQIEMSISFKKLEEIMDSEVKLGDFSKLDKKDIQNIKDFIDKSKNNDRISHIYSQAKKNVFDLYIKMYQYQETPNGKGITKYDIGNFNEIFDYISTTFSNNEIQNYELGLQFNGINETNLKNKAPENWDGKDLNKDDEAVKVMCKGHLFKPEDYAKEFNSKNEIRINSIIEQLSNYDITKFLNGFKLKYSSTEGETPYLVPKNDDESFSNLEDNAKKIKVRGILTKNVTGDIKNLVNGETELKQIIGMNHERTKSNILDNWTKKIIEELKKQSGVTESGNVQPENNPEGLREVNPDEIKNLRSGLDPQTVAGFLNNAIKKTDLNEDQKQLLLLAQKGLTTEDRTSNDIKQLQQKLGGIKDDGKFGIKTFNALSQKIGIKVENNVQTPAFQQNTKRERQQDTDKTPEEIQKEILSKIEGIHEHELYGDEPEYYGIEKDTQTYKRNGYNGIYYFNGKNELLYIPDVNKIGPGVSYNKQVDTVPLIRKTVDGKNRTKKYPNNGQMFNMFFVEKLRHYFPNEDYTKVSTTKINYDTDKGLFTVSNHGYKSYITKAMLEGNGWSKEIGKQLGLLSLQNFLIGKLIDHQPKGSNELLISNNTNTSSKFSGFEANRYNKNNGQQTWVQKRDIESKYIKRGYLEGIDTKNFFQNVVSLPKKKLQES